MASGNTLAVFMPQQNEPPASNYATYDLVDNRPVLDFDPDTSWSAVFSGLLPRIYSEGGITVTLVWVSAPTGTASTDVVWAVSFEAMASAFLITADSFASEQSATAPVSADDEVVYTTITFTDGAQIASLVGGQAFRLMVRRDAANASDTQTTAAQLLRVELKES